MTPPQKLMDLRCILLNIKISSKCMVQTDGKNPVPTVFISYIAILFSIVFTIFTLIGLAEAAAAGSTGARQPHRSSINRCIKPWRFKHTGSDWSQSNITALITHLLAMHHSDRSCLGAFNLHEIENSCLHERVWKMLSSFCPSLSNLSACKT